MRVEDVAAVIVTRGDVPLQPVLDCLIFDEVAVWDNSRQADMGAYGRYLAILQVSRPYIFTIDDDCTISADTQHALVEACSDGAMVSNMRANHNIDMPHLALPGWGAVFRRDLPARAFRRWEAAYPEDFGSDDFSRIGCDIIFPVLTPSVMLDLGHEDLPWAWDPHRTHVQPGYAEQKTRYYVEAARLRSVDSAA